LRDGGRLLRLAIRLSFDTSHLADQRLGLIEQQIASRLRRSRGQGQLAEPHQTFSGPQAKSFRWDGAGAAQGRADGILGPRPLGNHLAAAADQLTPRRGLRRGHVHGRRPVGVE
jgi:hypothetical protein